MQSTILVILPTWAAVFAISLPPSADSAKINIISTNGKQEVLNQPRAAPPGTKRRSQVTGHRSQLTGHRLQFAGHRSQVTG